jgi:hypothetical protein
MYVNFKPLFLNLNNKNVNVVVVVNNSALYSEGRFRGQISVRRSAILTEVFVFFQSTLRWMLG